MRSAAASARHPGPPRPQTRPALQDPRAAPPRRGTPHRKPAGQDHRLPRRRRPHRRGEHDLAVLPAAPLHLPRHPGQGPRDRDPRCLDSFHTCPIPEVARLGRTLRAWKAQVLAYFDTSGVSNGGTEAINLIIEKVRRLAHGFKEKGKKKKEMKGTTQRSNYAASGLRQYRTGGCQALKLLKATGRAISTSSRPHSLRTWHLTGSRRLPDKAAIFPARLLPSRGLSPCSAASDRPR